MMCRIFRYVVKQDFIKQEFVLEREFLIKYDVIVDQAQSRPVSSAVHLGSPSLPPNDGGGFLFARASSRQPGSTMILQDS